MMNRRSTEAMMTAGLALSAVFPLVANAGPVLIGGSSDGFIYDVDPLTGFATNPRDTGLGQLTGLAFTPDGVLYGRTGGLASEMNSLFIIDRGTGSSQVVGEIGQSSFDFDFDPTTSLLYGAASIQGTPNSWLHTIDPQSVIVNLIGVVGGTTASAAINPSGSLYLLAAQGDVLREIDKATGSTLASYLLGVNFRNVGVAFVTDGTLFVVDGGPGATNDFYTFDIPTAALTNVGPTGLPEGLTSLAYIPEPTTLMLLASGAVLLFGKRPRRRRNGLAMFLMSLLASNSHVFGQSGNGTAGSGTGTETGLGDLGTLVFNASVQGDFVVAGASTRVLGTLIPQSDPIFLEVSGIPPGATIVKAYANWS